ncbi:NADH-quinone oxidoreductase subunit N [Paenibacillus sp. UMB4589-SE434]|uniref:NADH-quinone oxidoreductase subunit N n=1 Tax=Paenibacillus sp. UMB4589-SE434 TaxID=3046314 RepID=UPI00254C7F86|nr:NADH-quinone oxidoreductase subunit N [Paenibacillus sp. UMB4589-SE434]MDK8181594.1 NADH-quinone oxidoreductase subunit N [Paenibacillus sp. UMB4589-SE434]
MNTMTVQPLQWSELSALAPELTLVIAAVLISLIDLLLPRRINREWIGILSLASVLFSLYFVVSTLVDRYTQAAGGKSVGALQLLNQSYRVDDFALFLKVLFLVGTAFVILISMGSMKDEELPHRGEYYYLLLPAVLGGMMMASSGDLITLYVGLELLSITSYILVGMKKNDRRSTEGAFKYAVLGSVASAFILYGMSFLYGMSGSTNLIDIAQSLATHVAAFQPLIYVSFLLLIVGLGFKIAAAPFHAWSPDVYQGAPTPITAFLAVVAKGASLAVVFRILFNVFFGLGAETDAEGQRVFSIYNDITIMLLAIAALSMVVGTTMALRQKNVKRLLALSGIANAGYLLVPIGLNILGNTINASVFNSFWYYLAAYLFTTIGAFAVLMVVSRVVGHEELKGFAGLYHRSPWLAVAMTVFVLSLAGIPVTAGFFGKLYIIVGAVAAHSIWITIVMMLTSVISFYFYFGFIRQMYMRHGQEGKITVGAPQGSVIVICVLCVLVFGLFPNEVMGWLNMLFSIPGDLFTLTP